MTRLTVPHSLDINLLFLVHCCWYSCSCSCSADEGPGCVPRKCHETRTNLTPLNYNSKRQVHKDRKLARGTRPTELIQRFSENNGMS